MTPPPASAASHAESSSAIALHRPAGEFLARAIGHLLDARTWSQLRLLVDVLVLYLASCAALFAAPGLSSNASRWLAAIFPALTIAILRTRRSADDRLHGSALDTTSQVLGVVSIAAMLTIATGSIIGGPHPVALALRLWLFSSVYLCVARLVLLSVRSQAVSNRALATPTLIIGAGTVGDQLASRLSGDARYGLRPVGFLDADPLPRSGRSAAALLPVLGGPDALSDAVRRTGARHVILAFSAQPDHVLTQIVTECQQLGVDISLVPRMFEAINDRATLDHIGGLPVLSLHPTNPRSWEFAIKHALDRTVALAALIATAPLLVAIALTVRATSPGPILFRQRRIGRDGRAFDLLKFRTMREPDSAVAFDLPSGCAPGGVEGADRRTPLGRFLRESSLDELPQLINVLRGDMSIVGPRPERPEFVERFASEVNRYQDRHRVKSGITGWAQVHGLRGQTSIADRVEWDNYYIQNWSLSLDLRIMLLTVAEVLRLSGDTARPDA
jgi:exopolysaccharide biosynthesis polyprenyl glycosylphosphotransferase